MSGFFLLDRKFFQLAVGKLTGTGFKILVDLLASSPRPVRLGEIPYHFRDRQRGESKLDVNVELEYLFLVVDKLVGRAISTRFAVFVLVGSLGLVIPWRAGAAAFPHSDRFFASAGGGHCRGHDVQFSAERYSDVS
jgi:dolichol-phosphate mannosyltransferase